MTKWVNKIICSLFSHEWALMYGSFSYKKQKLHMTKYKCVRCGKEKFGED